MATVEPQLMTAAPRGVPVEWPCNFDGNEPLPWIDRIERVFCRLGIIDPYRVKIASIFFDGPVVPWFQELQQSGLVTSWELLKNAILAAAREETFQLKTQKDVVIDDRKESDMSIEMALESEDAPQVFAEMPQGIVDVASIFTAGTQVENACGELTCHEHDIHPEGIMPDDLPIGAVQHEELTSLHNLSTCLDSLQAQCSSFSSVNLVQGAEFATVRHRLEVWEERLADMVQPVNFVAILTTSHRPDHIALIPAGPLNREEQIWASTDDADWRLSSDSGLWHCIQTFELRSSFAPQAEVASFNQVVGLPHSTLLLLATAKKIVIYAVHLDYGLVDVFDVFQQLSPWVEAVLLGRCDSYSSMEASEELIENSGRLHLLVITHEKERVTGLKIEHLEETSVASTTPYLANVVVYIGSNYGDSQFIKLNMQPDAKGSYVNILDAYVNLGPLVDFCIVDRKRQGQDQVVTGSGAYKDGSLRVVRNAIGINEQASVDLQGITDLWPLRCSTNDPYDTFLVVRFINETRVLAMNMADELEEIEIAGFYDQAPKLFCQNALNDQLLPVASGSVRLVSSPSRELVDEWNATTGFSVNVATTNAIQVLLATSGGHLVYLEIGIGKFSEVNHTQLEYELSCLDINPIGDHSSYSSLVAVVMWTDVSGRMLSLPGLDLVTKECVGGEINSCSVLLCTFEGIPYLLCALGDGHLFNFQLKAWSCRCVQRTLFQCDDINPSSIGENDRFPEMPDMILPENNQSMEVHSAGACLLICLQNCTCVAYLHRNKCLIWFGDRMHAKEPTHVQGSQQPSSALYLSLAASEFPTSRRTKVNVLVVFVIALMGTIISSVALVLISRRRRMYMIRKLDAIQGILLSFPYTQLQNTIGIGGFASVFNGTLSDSSVVGVTKLESLRQREEVVRPAEQVIMVGYRLAMKGVSLLLMNTLPNTKEELMNIVAAKVGIHARNKAVTNEEGAYELVMTMQAEENAGVCGDLLGGCVYTKSESTGTCWQMFPLIGSSYIIDPASEHYAAMIEVLSYWGCFDEAEKLIHNKPFKPNALIWRALLDSFKPKTVQSFYARDRSHPRSQDIYRGLVVLTLDCINAGQATDPSFVLHDVGEYQKDFIYYHCATLAVTYVHFDLEDKVKFDGRGNVTIYWDMFLNVSQSRGKADGQRIQKRDTAAKGVLSKIKVVKT